MISVSFTRLWICTQVQSWEKLNKELAFAHAEELLAPHHQLSKGRAKINTAWNQCHSRS